MSDKACTCNDWHEQLARAFANQDPQECPVHVADALTSSAPTAGPTVGLNQLEEGVRLMYGAAPSDPSDFT